MGKPIKWTEQMDYELPDSSNKLMARKYGISESAIRERRKKLGLPTDLRGELYSEEFKHEVCADAVRFESTTRAAKKHGVWDATIARWMRERGYCRPKVWREPVREYEDYGILPLWPVSEELREWQREHKSEQIDNRKSV